MIQRVVTHLPSWLRNWHCCWITKMDQPSTAVQRTVLIRATIAWTGLALIINNRKRSSGTRLTSEIQSIQHSVLPRRPSERFTISRSLRRRRRMNRMKTRTSCTRRWRTSGRWANMSSRHQHTPSQRIKRDATYWTAPTAKCKKKCFAT